MSYTNKDVSSLIVDFLSTIVDKAEVSEDNIDSLNVAIDCITDVFDIDRNSGDATSIINKKFNGHSLLQILSNIDTASAPNTTKSNATEDEGERVKVNIPVEDAEIKAKAETFKLEGNKAMAQKDYQTAIDKYTQAIQCLPTNAIYYANRAAAYTSLQNYEEAVNDAEEAIKIDPTYSKGYSRLAYAKYVQDKPEEALEAYKKVMEIEGDKVTDVTRRSYETAKKKVEESLRASAIEKSNAQPEKDETDTARDANSSTDAGASAGGFPDLASMLGGGLGGGLGSFLNNPQLMQTAQQMMSDPSTMSKMQSMMQNPAIRQMAQNFAGGNANMDDIMNNPAVRDMASNLFGGAAPGGDNKDNTNNSNTN